MFEWIKDFIIALGGGTVVLVGILTIFKGLFVKFFESGIETSFEKSLEKFKNTLERSTRAYDILLNREMEFYERVGPITAELVPLEQDLLYLLKYDDDSEHRKKCADFREQFERYGELIKSLKNESLIHQCYIPQEIFSAFSKLVGQMQDDTHYWYDMAKFLFVCEYDKIDYKKAEEVVDALLMCLATAEMAIKKRLAQLCCTSECIK